MKKLESVILNNLFNERLIYFIILLFGILLISISSASAAGHDRHTNFGENIVKKHTPDDTTRTHDRSRNERITLPYDKTGTVGNSIRTSYRETRIHNSHDKDINGVFRAPHGASNHKTTTTYKSEPNNRHHKHERLLKVRKLPTMVTFDPNSVTKKNNRIKIQFAPRDKKNVQVNDRKVGVLSGKKYTSTTGAKGRNHIKYTPTKPNSVDFKRVFDKCGGIGKLIKCVSGKPKKVDSKPIDYGFGGKPKKCVDSGKKGDFDADGFDADNGGGAVRGVSRPDNVAMAAVKMWNAGNPMAILVLCVLSIFLIVFRGQKRN